MTDAAKLGRPTVLTEDVQLAFFERLAEGESVRSICRDPEMPGLSTIFRALRSNEIFRQQYAHATEIRADAQFEEMFEIADDASNDWMEKNVGEDKQAVWELNGEHIQRSKLRIDTRKWALARMNPRKYGERVDLNHGGQPENPLSVTVIERRIVNKPQPDNGTEE